MSCYQCVHCGKCPVGNMAATITCSECGAPLGPGITHCPNCNVPIKGHMKFAGADDGPLFIKPGDSFIAKLGKGNRP